MNEWSHRRNIYFCCMNEEDILNNVKGGTCPQFIIAAPSSASGKTTVSRGLMAALVKRGMVVQPFKCGPDYIDTKFHSVVCGRRSVNLDSFLASENHIREIYARYSQGADACIVEGMMGLFDGYSRDRGSSAEIASLLGLPVVLVVNAQSAAYSLAALLKGFIGFRQGVRIVGVLFNKVGSARHSAMLDEVCRDLGLTCFGCLPNDADLRQNSRYLGLDFSDLGADSGHSRLVSLVEEYVDIDRLLEMTTTVSPQYVGVAHDSAESHPNRNVVVAKDDEAFSFLYAEHVDILRRLGRVSFFRPDSDQPIPDDTDLLYLPGGYPEKHAENLTHAQRTMNSIYRYIEAGGRTIAECGGMIYLSRGIILEDNYVPMVGVLPFSVSFLKENRKLSLGYRRFCLGDQDLRGHEFHYSSISPADWNPHDRLIDSVEVFDAKGMPTGSPVFRYKNLIASYVHLYWGETDIMNLF